MRTITKILGYKPITQQNIELLTMWGFYNGTGADGLFFDNIIDEIFKSLRKTDIFQTHKWEVLREDIRQLVIRHDIDTGFKIGFRRSNRRLAWWLYKLLHHFPFKYRIVISLWVFYAVHFTSKAKKNYKLIK